MCHIYLVTYFFFSSRRRHTRCALVTGVQTCALPIFLPLRADPLAVRLQRRHKASRGELTTALEQFENAAMAVPDGMVILNRSEQKIGRASCRERVCQYV